MTIRETGKERKSLVQRLQHFSHVCVILRVSSFFKFVFIYLVLAVLGLQRCMWAFSSCGERRLLFIAECGLLIVVVPLVAGSPVAQMVKDLPATQETWA